MLLTIPSTRPPGEDSQYPVLEEVWFFPFWLTFRRSKRSNLLVKDSWYHVMSKRSHRGHTSTSYKSKVYSKPTQRRGDPNHVILLQSSTNHNTYVTYNGCVPLGWSGSGWLIRDHSDHGRSACTKRKSFSLACTKTWNAGLPQRRNAGILKPRTQNY